MKNNNFLLIFLIALTIIIGAYLVTNDHHDDHSDGHQGHDDHAEESAEEKGPNGGKLLRVDNFALELKIFESGVPPEYHVYAYDNNKLVPAADVDLTIKLHRLDGEVNTISFAPMNDFLRGDTVIVEPHSFDVSVSANYNGKLYQWQYDSYEGRTEINPEIAQVSGVKTEKASSQKLQQTLDLNGRIQLDPNRVSHVRARFPGVVQQVKAELGQTVKKGELLAIIQSNDSLQNYKLTAPVSGTIIQRDIQPGEVSSDSVLYVIADLSTVWAELDVFNQDIALTRTGQHVEISTLQQQKHNGTISWLSPMATHTSQSIKARVVLANPDLELRPGQYINARVTVATHQVALAVRESAIQAFRDFDVVFAKIGNIYEVRMLELGRKDQQWVEVLGGLKPGTEYVSENSYLIKADIEKSGASHDH